MCQTALLTLPLRPPPPLGSIQIALIHGPHPPFTIPRTKDDEKESVGIQKGDQQGKSRPGRGEEKCKWCFGPEDIGGMLDAPGITREKHLGKNQNMYEMQAPVTQFAEAGGGRD